MRVPSRSPFAYLLALFVPYAGRLGSGAGVIIVVAMIGALAAIALPAYQSYQQRMHAAEAWNATTPLRQGLAAFFEKNGQAPESLEQAGLPQQYQGRPLEFDARNMVVSVPLRQGVLELVPRLDDDKRVQWNCGAGEGLPPAALPPSCR